MTNPQPSLDFRRQVCEILSYDYETLSDFSIQEHEVDAIVSAHEAAMAAELEIGKGEA